jgi:ABC-type transport system substrate-binding protein
MATSTLLGLTACGGSAVSARSREGNVEKSEFGGEALAAGKPVRGGKFTFAMASPVEHLDPTKPVGTTYINPMHSIYDALMTTDADGNPVPYMAKSMEASKDLRTWTMTLPAGVRFSDGTAFNAQAVIDHVKNVAKSTSLQALQAQQIPSMTAKSETVVEFELNEPWAGFSSLFADASSLAMVPSPTAFAKEGARFGTKPVGAGPFVVTSFVPGQSLTVKRNPHYYRDDVPYADIVEYQVLPEPTTRISGLQSGDVDIATLGSPADVQAAESAGLTVLTQSGFNYYVIIMNLKDPTLKDLRVRRAISMAIDRDSLNQVVSHGENEPMAGFFTKNHPFYQDDANWPAYDQKAARQLVRELKAESGRKKIALEMTLPGISEMSRSAAVVQQMLADVGIDLTYRTVAPTTMVAAAAGDDWQLQMRDSGIQPETLMRMDTHFNSKSPANLIGEANPGLDRLFARAKQVKNKGEREALIQQIQVELNAWMPQIPLLTRTSAVAVGSQVTHFPGIYPSTSNESFDAALVAVERQ